MVEVAPLYDDLAETYAAGRHRFDTTPILEEFARFLPRGARVLDAGCGAGEPVARYYRTPHGWLYNVSGYEAVEIALASGKRLRLGTDEPHRLAQALRAAMRERG